MIWEPFILALVLGIIVSAGLYFAYLWPSVEPVEPAGAEDSVGPVAAAPVVAAPVAAEPGPAPEAAAPAAEAPPAAATDDAVSPAS